MKKILSCYGDIFMLLALLLCGYGVLMVLMSFLLAFRFEVHIFFQWVTALLVNHML
ncbi:hypothetical protein [Pantoea agglomerans]|uniref:hypothetical protein n=2 Tax=Pantoea TaxID=53335 RepID=UPI002A1941EF|nr:hypothetical protein [Pantoea sp. JV6]